MNTEMKNYIISAHVRNHFGVLTRISGLFSRRGYNIRSLTVGETENPSVSRMTVEFFGDERTLMQIESQLSKVEDVIDLEELKEDESIRCELFLVKVAASGSTQKDVAKIAAKYGATEKSTTEKALVFELTGDGDKLHAFLLEMNILGKTEISRTGITAISM